MSNARRRTGRIPRERATEHVLELLEKICAEEGAAKCVTAVYAFGSWSRGAVEVGDVDLDIEYDPRRDPETERQMVHAIVSGRDPTVVLRKALKPRRALHVLYQEIGKIGEPALLYKDGDDLDTALARVQAIVLDPSAGRADREPVHPSLTAVSDALSRPSLITLGELARHGFISVSVVDVPDVGPTDIQSRAYRDFVARAWSEASPRGRAARAAGSLLIGRGLKPSELLVLERSPTGTRRRAMWAIEAREGKLQNVAYDLGRGMEGWLYIVRPDLRQPLRGLEITRPTDSQLDEAFDLDTWLYANAPHIQHIGAATD